MSVDDQPTAADSVDWSTVRQQRPSVPPLELLVFVVGTLGIVSLFLYDQYIAHVYLIYDWRIDPEEWLFLYGLVILASIGLVPAVKRWSSTSKYLKKLLRRPASAISLVYLLTLVVVGLIGPIVISYPGLAFGHAHTPPVGFSTGVSPGFCGGITAGEPFNRICQGTWEYPLGTDRRGLPMGFLVMSGARVSLYVIVFTAAFIVPLAVVTGIVAGLRGGLIDDLLMAYVDVQLILPAIIVYFLFYVTFGVSLALLLVTFGIFSWGGIARLVRSEVIQRREAGHVLVAKSHGASNVHIALRHILPNVSNTVVPAAFQLMALLILVEAGIAFLGYHDINMHSWGSTIAEGSNSLTHLGLFPTELEIPAREIWWTSTFPALALAMTIFSFKLLGDGIRDVFDPRMGSYYE